MSATTPEQDAERARTDRQEMIEEGWAVQRFMDDSTVQGCFDAIRRSLFQQWLNTGPGDGTLREEIWGMAQGQERLEAWLRTIADRGEQALAEVQYEDDRKAIDAEMARRTGGRVRREM